VRKQGTLPLVVHRQADPKTAQGLALLDAMQQDMPDFYIKVKPKGIWRETAMHNLMRLGLDAGQAAHVLWFWTRVKRRARASR
jgi:hypothetical protein